LGDGDVDGHRFALGLLALVGSGFPTRLRAFMLTGSVVDDVGALARDRDRLQDERLESRRSWSRSASSRASCCSAPPNIHIGPLYSCRDGVLGRV
jgi:hypothetical protein